jgi:hypothetical protein
MKGLMNGSCTLLKAECVSSDNWQTCFEVRISMAKFEHMIE